jgi:hypothetical protein
MWLALGSDLAARSISWGAAWPKYFTMRTLSLILNSYKLEMRAEHRKFRNDSFKNTT